MSISSGGNGLFSIYGISSGLDTSSIIQSLVSMQKAQETPLQNEEAKNNADIAAWNGLTSYISAFQASIQTLTDPNTWNGVSSSSTNSGVVTATTSSGATAGSYNVKVSSLAQAETMQSYVFGDTTKGAQYASFQGQAGEFDITQNGKTAKVNLSGGETLSQVASDINSAAAKSGVGVTASVITQSNGNSQLVINSNNTGTANSFTVADVSGTNAATLGLTSTNSNYIAQSAADAAASINGVNVTSSTNTFNNVVNGVTFTALATGNSTVTVSQDTQPIMDAVNGFIKAYNQLSSAMQTDTKIDTSNSSNNGPLAGDSLMQGLENNLASTVGGLLNTGSTVLQGLAQAGITLNTDGTIGFDSTVGGQSKFESLLSSNMKDMENLFGVTSTSGLTSSTGLGGALNNFLNMANDPKNGIINNAVQSLTDSNTQIQAQIDQIEAASQLYQTNLEAQFNAMEVSIAAMKSQSSWLNSFASSSSSSSTSSSSTSSSSSA